MVGSVTRLDIPRAADRIPLELGYTDWSIRSAAFMMNCTLSSADYPGEPRHATKEVRSPAMSNIKCQQCDSAATFHITELTGGEPQELHLCEEHARQYLAPSEEDVAESLPAVAGMLAQHLAVGETAEELARLDRQSCPVCGITFLEFRKQGRLGCPHDYECFFKELQPLLLNIHGETSHVGKCPSCGPGGTEVKTQLIRLRREMKGAVDQEKYELASEIRDRINRTEEREASKPAESSEGSTSKGPIPEDPTSENRE